MFTLFFLTTGSFKPLRRLLSIFVKEKTGSSVDLNDKTILFKALQDHAQIVAQYFDLRTQSYLKMLWVLFLGLTHTGIAKNPF